MNLNKNLSERTSSMEDNYVIDLAKMSKENADILIQLHDSFLVVQKKNEQLEQERQKDIEKNEKNKKELMEKTAAEEAIVKDAIQYAKNAIQQVKNTLKNL